MSKTFKDYEEWVENNKSTLSELCSTTTGKVIKSLSMLVPGYDFESMINASAWLAKHIPNDHRIKAQHLLGERCETLRDEHPGKHAVDIYNELTEIGSLKKVFED